LGCEGEEFCDLGCGAGKAILAASLLVPFAKVKGMDLLPASIRAGKRLLGLYRNFFNSEWRCDGMASISSHNEYSIL
jgi:2-polyprenyl-3-methyl-5-hydroxy-6-metoxy-1,4-benzoquinol methylase